MNSMALEQVNFLQEEAIKLSLNDNFVASINLLEQVRVQLDSVFDEDPFEHRLREATIERDIGMVALRFIVRSDERYFFSSDSHLSRSQDMLSELKQTYPEKSYQTKINDELAATVNALGRRNLVYGVLGQDSETIKQAASNFIAADLHSKKGKNHYYRTVNAMNGAQAERILGNRPRVKKWLGKAALTVTVAPLRDPKNAVPSAKSYFGRLPSLATSDTAKARALTRP